MGRYKHIWVCLRLRQGSDPGMAAAFARRQGALVVRFEPVADAGCMPAMLAGLAPEEPLVELLIKVLLLLCAVEQRLLFHELVARVQHRDWLEANCARREPRVAEETVGVFDVGIITVLELVVLQKLVSEHLYVDLDGERLRADVAADLVLVGSGVKAVGEDLGLGTGLFLAHIGIDLPFTVVDAALMTGSSTCSSQPCTALASHDCPCSLRCVNQCLGALQSLTRGHSSSNSKRSTSLAHKSWECLVQAIPNYIECRPDLPQSQLIQHVAIGLYIAPQMDGL